MNFDNSGTIDVIEDLIRISLFEDYCENTRPIRAIINFVVFVENLYIRFENMNCFSS